MLISLDELLRLITDAWPDRWNQGRLLHVHRNALTLKDGSIVHLRVLVQRIQETPILDKITVEEVDNV